LLRNFWWANAPFATLLYILPTWKYLVWMRSVTPQADGQTAGLRPA
jgi:hypothetical protein